MANRAEIESFESVKTWIDFLDQTGSGSENTKIGYLYRFGNLCEDLGLNPDEILEKARADQAGFEKDIAKWYSKKLKAVQAKSKKQFTRSNVFHTWMVLKSFLRHNGIALKTKVKAPRPEIRSAVSKETLRKILDYSSVKLRAYIMVARDSGLAPADILELRYRDIKEEFEKGVVPCAIVKRREKTKVALHTFLGIESVKALKTYLATKDMKDDAFIFTTYRNKPKGLEYKSLQDQFKRACKQAKSGAQLYDLRKYFMTNLRADEANEIMIKYWSGHSLGVENGYTNPDLEKSREVYKKHYSALSFESELAKQVEVEKTTQRIEKLEQEKDELMTQLKAVLEKLGLDQIPQGKS